MDLAFFSANTTKFLAGGWLRAVCPADHSGDDHLEAWPRVGAREARAPGVILAGLRRQYPDTSAAAGAGNGSVPVQVHQGRAPRALLHNLKHNKVLHERVIFLTIQGEG